MSEIVIRVLESIEDFEQAVEIEIAVWGVQDRDVIPSSLMQAIRSAGGISLGAYDGEVMIGMSVAFPGFRNGTPMLWSHVTGVLSDYQHRNVGYRLKQAQAEWGRAAGYREIRWTFDPLQAGNANFNLRMLGVTSNLYYINFYGTMNDAINRGIASDRLEASWDLTTTHQPRVSNDYANTSPYLLSGAEDRPVSHSEAIGQNFIRIEIPCSLKALDVASRKAWRLALREALIQAFNAGYTAVDFLRDADRCAYLLRLDANL